jgi:hypothetical protein
MLGRIRHLGPAAQTGLLALAAGLTLLTAACSSGTSTPQVASLGSTTGSSPSAGSSTSGVPTGNPTQLLDEWATCMRGHGDPGQSDPTIDSNKVIHITFPTNASTAVTDDSSGPCQSYLTAASTALRGGQPLQRPDQAQLLALAVCMRANGIPNFPDPVGDNLNINAGPGSDLNPNNPTFKKALKLCAKKTGIAGMLANGANQPGNIVGQGSQTSGGGGNNGGSGGNG